MRLSVLMPTLFVTLVTIFVILIMFINPGPGSVMSSLCEDPEGVCRESCEEGEVVNSLRTCPQENGGPERQCCFPTTPNN